MREWVFKRLVCCSEEASKQLQERRNKRAQFAADLRAQIEANERKRREDDEKARKEEEDRGAQSRCSDDSTLFFHVQKRAVASARKRTLRAPKLC